MSCYNSTHLHGQRPINHPLLSATVTPSPVLFNRGRWREKYLRTHDASPSPRHDTREPCLEGQMGLSKFNPILLFVVGHNTKTARLREIFGNDGWENEGISHLVSMSYKLPLF